MAEPKTEIDRRLDRIELAIGSLAWILVNNGALDDQSAIVLEKILHLDESVREAIRNVTK